MIINYERSPTCFWHNDCEVSVVGHGVMKEVRREPERTLMKCLHCGKQGYYPVGGNGCVHTEEVEQKDEQPGHCPTCKGARFLQNDVTREIRACWTCNKDAPVPASLLNDKSVMRDRWA